MPIDGVAVGSNLRSIVVIGDPSTAAQMQSVLALGDSKNLAGSNAGLVGSVNWLQNASGLYEIQRSAAGAVGIPVVNMEGTKPTYSCGVLGFTPVATPTDFWQILGSATKVVRVLRISLSGVATSGATVATQLIARSTASTGGTPSPQTAMHHDSNDSAPTAVVNTFAANPSPLGTSAGVGRAQALNLGAAGSAGLVVWDFTTRNGRGLVLRGVAQSLNLNWNGAAVPAGTLLNIDVEFTEE